MRVRRVDAQPDRDPVNSAEKHMPGHAGVPSHPCAAIVVAVVAGQVRAFRAERVAGWWPCGYSSREETGAGPTWRPRGARCPSTFSAASDDFPKWAESLCI
jgi:hypothetical protein